MCGYVGACTSVCAHMCMCQIVCMSFVRLLEVRRYGGSSKSVATHDGELPCGCSEQNASPLREQ